MAACSPRRSPRSCCGAIRCRWCRRTRRSRSWCGGAGCRISALLPLRSAGVVTKDADAAGGADDAAAVEIADVVADVDRARRATALVGKRTDRGVAELQRVVSRR